MYKNLLHLLYINNELSESEIHNPIYNCVQKNKIPRNKFTKEVKDLYTENYKTLMTEIEEDT